MSSEIVIVWEAEEPIRYHPQQTNLMRIRTKSSELNLFNSKNIYLWNNFIKFAAFNSSTCKCTQDGDSQTTPKKQRAEEQEYK